MRCIFLPSQTASLSRAKARDQRPWGLGSFGPRLANVPGAVDEERHDGVSDGQRAFGGRAADLALPRDAGIIGHAYEAAEWDSWIRDHHLGGHVQGVNVLVYGHRDV